MFHSSISCLSVCQSYVLSISFFLFRDFSFTFPWLVCLSVTLGKAIHRKKETDVYIFLLKEKKNLQILACLYTDLHLHHKFFSHFGPYKVQRTLWQTPCCVFVAGDLVGNVSGERKFWMWRRCDTTVTNADWICNALQITNKKTVWSQKSPTRTLFDHVDFYRIFIHIREPQSVTGTPVHKT